MGCFGNKRKGVNWKGQTEETIPQHETHTKPEKPSPKRMSTRSACAWFRRFSVSSALRGQSTPIVSVRNPFKKTTQLDATSVREDDHVSPGSASGDLRSGHIIDEMCAVDMEECEEVEADFLKPVHGRGDLHLLSTKREHQSERRSYTAKDGKKKVRFAPEVTNISHAGEMTRSKLSKGRRLSIRSALRLRSDPIVSLRNPFKKSTQFDATSAQDDDHGSAASASAGHGPGDKMKMDIFNHIFNEGSDIEIDDCEGVEADFSTSECGRGDLYLVTKNEEQHSENQYERRPFAAKDDGKPIRLSPEATYINDVVRISSSELPEGDDISPQASGVTMRRARRESSHSEEPTAYSYSMDSNQEGGTRSLVSRIVDFVFDHTPLGRLVPFTWIPE